MESCDEQTKTTQGKLNIFKFGGSCFKTFESFGQSLKIVKHYKNDKLIIVCSALFGITDKLLEFGNSVFVEGDNEEVYRGFLAGIRNEHQRFINKLLNQNPDLLKQMEAFIDSKIKKIEEYIPQIKENGMNPKNSDYVLSYGERLSAFLFTEFLKSQGLDAIFVEADEKLIITNDEHSNALPLLEKCELNILEKIYPPLKENKIIVVPGYYGSTENGVVTTLGRGGTDFTTTIVGYALAEKFDTKVIFWKDVDGILAANPKYVPTAKLLKKISYAEAKELAYFGTKILHPKCLKLAEQREIGAELRNFTNPFQENFTLITNDCVIPRKSDEMIKAITSLDQIAMITVQSDAMISLPGTAARIFSLMGEYNININFISQSSSENNMTFGTSLENGFKAIKVLKQSQNFGTHWFDVIIDNEVSLVSVVGAGMIHKTGVAGLLFTTLGNAGVNIRAISQGSSELNITLIIARNDLKRAVSTLANTFIEGNLPTKISRW
jgi:aspartate kinase